MKVLYITRLFSGLEKSLIDKRWQPSGVPTIYKIMESLSKNSSIETYFALLPLNDNERWNIERQIEIEGFNAPINTLPGLAAIPTFFKKVSPYLLQIKQLCLLVKHYRRIKPDVIYIDRTNYYAAALFSRFTRTKVIWRVMGVLEIMKHDLERKGLRGRLRRWAYRSPFKLVICTKDGSDGELWLKKALHPKTTYRMMLNGIDPTVIKRDIAHTSKTNILFLCRLEPMKGCDTLVAAVSILKKEIPSLFHITVIGEGSLRKELENNVKQLGLEKYITFVGATAHNKVNDFYLASDIFISLNTHGNITNTNLEAIAAGCCVVIPRKDSESQIDSDTETLFPPEVVCRFGSARDSNALAKKLIQLINTPCEIRGFSANALNWKKRHLKSWEKRVEEEITLIKTI